MWLVISPIVATCFWAMNQKEQSLKKGLFAQLAAFVASAICLGIYFYTKKSLFSLDGEASDFIAGRYSQFGSSIADLILSPIRQPSVFWQVISAPEKLGYLLDLFLPLFGLVALVIWQMMRDRSRCSSTSLILLVFCSVLIAPAPLCKVLLSNYAPYLAKENHYAADILPALVILSYVLSLKLSPKMRGMTINAVCTVCGIFIGLMPLRNTLHDKIFDTFCFLSIRNYPSTQIIQRYQQSFAPDATSMAIWQPGRLRQIKYQSSWC